MMLWSAHKLPLINGSVDILIMDMYFGKLPKKIPRHYKAFVPRVCTVQLIDRSHRACFGKGSVLNSFNMSSVCDSD